MPSQRVLSAEPPVTGLRPVAEPGRNCWRRAHASRLAALVDGDSYYRALKTALLNARHTILLVGWEIDSRTVLDRRPGADQPNTLGALLDHVVRARPDLRAYVLIWDSALIYSWHREFLPITKMRWMTHRRLHCRLDDTHPMGASHHQKMIVIDDAVAFLGGMDVSAGRWDTRAHAANDPRRSDELNASYPPYHDVMLMMSGEVAAVLGGMARERWRNATGQRLPPPAPRGDPWPKDIPPLIRDVMVALARTAPAWEGAPAVREVERLYLDMIAAARRFIYIENQYFASRIVTRALASRLREPDGPEVVVVSAQHPTGFLERTAMGLARARLHARLLKADRHGRFMLCYPRAGTADVKVHSKLMIVDDVMLRVGSANLNNRSMGLDTECDVLVEALGDTATRDAIGRLRCDLMAEHLGTTPERVAQEMAARGSLLATIRALSGGERSLMPLSPGLPEVWLDGLDIGDSFDPDRPIEEALYPEERLPGPPKRPLPIRVLALTVVLALLGVVAALWHWGPLAGVVDPVPMLQWLAEWRHRPLAGVAAIGLYLAGGLLALPISLLSIAIGGIFGALKGWLYAFVGIMASAAAFYAIGGALGRDRVRRLAGRRVTRVSRELPRRGIVMVALLRLVPVASFTVINLVCGALRVDFRAYLVGTAIGAVPIAGAMALFGERLAAVLVRPDLFNLGALVVTTTALVLAGLSLVRHLARAAPHVRVREDSE